MPFPYLAILKKAFALSRVHLSLWIFGIFLSLSSVLNFLVSNLVLAERQLIDFSLGETARKIAAWADSPLGIANIFLVIAILYLSALSKATVIWSAQKLAGTEQSLADREKKFTLERALKEGARFVWPVFWLQALLMFLFSLLFASLAAPVVYLTMAGETGRAIALAVLGSAIFVPVSVLLILTFLYSPIFAVLYKVRMRAALSLAFALAQNKFKESLIMAVFLSGIMLLFIILLAFSIIVVSVPVAFLFLVLSKLGLVWAISTLIFIAALLGLCAIVILSAGLAVFNNFVWVLTVIELVKTEKTDEAAKVLAPEAEPAA